MLGELAEQAWSCLVGKDNPKWRATTPRERADNQDHYPARSFIRHMNMNGPPSVSAAVDFNFVDRTMTTPALDKHELDSAFRELLVEANLNPDKECELWRQPLEVKRLMLIEQHARKGGNLSNLVCDNLVRRLENYVKNYPVAYSLPLAVQHLEALAISLRTECISFVRHFIAVGGVKLLTSLVDQSRTSVDDGEALMVPALNCFRALLNTQIGQEHVVGSESSPTTLLAIVGALDSRAVRCKLLALEILSGICLLLPDLGHEAVLTALTEATHHGFFGERVRFQKLVDDLHRPFGHHARETERVRIALMSLVNSLLRTGPSESLEFRLHLRYELLMLGIQEVIDKLRGMHGSALEDHFDLFEMMRQEDELEMQGSVDSGSSSPIDMESPSCMAEALSRKLDNTLALPHLISTLRHMLMISGDETHLHLWHLFDLMVQQLSLHTALGDFATADPLFNDSPLRLDVNELISRLKTNHECDVLQKKLSEVTLELESEKRRVVELENKLGDLQDGFSLSSFSRISDLSSSPSDPCHSPTPGQGGTNTAGEIPPVRPPPCLAPPPPPPSLLRNGAACARAAEDAQKKKVPKPPGPMRTINWAVLPSAKIAGTIWEKMEDEKLYQHLNLNELSSSFFAGKSGGEEAIDTGMSTLHRRLRNAEPTLISVIDARRAQNCTIMLSKLRLSNREIRQAIWSMDDKNRLPKDMIEQMLKFIPTKEELILLKETLNKHRSPAVLAMADRYLLELGQIPRCEQRLRCLHILRTFKERVDELLPYFNAVIRASTTVSGSKKLRQFMAMVLAIGNYLNYGKRNGNAEGFQINSLAAIHQVKSALRSDRNLMHFLVQSVENGFPELLRLKKELASIYEASKYNQTEMEVEFRLCESSLRELANELAVVRSSQQKYRGEGTDNGCMPTETSEACSAFPASSAEGDELKKQAAAEPPPMPTSRTSHSACRFIPVVTTFLEAGRKTLLEAQGLHRDMWEKYTKCAKLFAADAPRDRGSSASATKNEIASSQDAAVSSDEFFGSFAKCITQFTECSQQLWEERAEAERTRRQTLSRQIFAKKNGKKRGSREGDFDSLVNEIFSDELNRLRASVRISNHAKHSR